VTGGLAVLGDDIAITRWTITTRDGRPVAFAGRATVERLQQSIDRAVKGWAEVFSEAAATHRLSDKMRQLYQIAPPRDYKHDREIADCLRDIGRLENLAVNVVDVVLEYSCDARTDAVGRIVILCQRRTPENGLQQG
jgi:NAD-specific glutamate dehydrogenase